MPKDHVCPICETPIARPARGAVPEFCSVHVTLGRALRRSAGALADIGADPRMVIAAGRYLYDVAVVEMSGQNGRINPELPECQAKMAE